MTPQLRSAFFALPLCDGDVTKETDFVSGRKRVLLYQIQNLFALLQESDVDAIETKQLTASFGWEAKAGADQ